MTVRSRWIRPGRACVLSGLALCALPSLAQVSDGSRPTLWVSPRLSVQGLVADRSTAGTDGRQSDGSLTVSPGLRVVANRAALKGFLDYNLSDIERARGPNRSTLQHTLNAQGKAELVDQKVFLDLSAVASRQIVSEQGQQVVSSLQRDNQTQTFTGVLSPYVQTRLPQDIDLLARYNATGVMTRTPTIADTLSQTGSLRLSQRLGGGLTWAVDGSSQHVLYHGPRPEVDLRSASAQLGYTFDAHLQLYVKGGVESNNATLTTAGSHGQSGWGMDWTPDAFTRFSASRNLHAYGTDHAVSFEQRWRRSVLRFSDAQSLSLLPTTTTVGTLGTLNQLLNSAFAQLEEDPVARAQLVQSFLQSRGLSGDTLVQQTYLSSGARVQRMQQLAWVTNWTRDSLTLSLMQSWSRQLRGQAGLSLAALNTVADTQSQGWTVAWGHRLTPRDNLSLTLAQQRVTGLGASVASNGSQSAALTLGSALTRQMVGNFTLRRTRSTGSLLPYEETSLAAGLVYQF